MADVRGLLADPEFQRLDQGTQKSVLGRIDPDFANISDEEFGQVMSRLGGGGPQGPPGPTTKVGPETSAWYLSQPHTKLKGETDEQYNWRMGVTKQIAIDHLKEIGGLSAAAFLGLPQVAEAALGGAVGAVKAVPSAIKGAAVQRPLTTALLTEGGARLGGKTGAAIGTALSASPEIAAGVKTGMQNPPVTLPKPINRGPVWQGARATPSSAPSPPTATVPMQPDIPPSNALPAQMPNTVTSPETAPAPMPVDRSGLNNMVHGLGQKLGMDHEFLSGIAKNRYGVKSMQDMSHEQMVDFYATLLKTPTPAGDPLALKSTGKPSETSLENQLTRSIQQTAKRAKKTDMPAEEPPDITAYAKGGVIKDKHYLVHAKTGKVDGVMSEAGPEKIVPMKEPGDVGTVEKDVQSGQDVIRGSCDIPLSKKGLAMADDLGANFATAGFGRG